MGSGDIHDFMVGTHDGTISPVLPCQPLDHLIRTLAPLGVDYLHTGSMLPLLGRSAMLPAIEHNSDGVVFSMPINGQIMQQHFTSGFRASQGYAATSENVIPIDDQMRRHPRRYREVVRTVNTGIGLRKRRNS